MIMSNDFFEVTKSNFFELQKRGLETRKREAEVNMSALKRFRSCDASSLKTFVFEESAMF